MFKGKPNFLIVGGAKCGSTSLYQYLNQHPEVYMPINKEPNYFVAKYQQMMSHECPTFKLDMDRMVFDENTYYELFKKADESHKRVGEATVTYLFKPDYAIPEIKKELGDVPIVIILRNPIKRAFSHYSYCCELGFEKLPFIKAIEIEKERLASCWSSTFAYISQGMFFEQVKAYKESFSNVHIMILDDFVQNKQESLRDLYEFLNISKEFKNDFSENFNVSGIPKSRFLHNLLIQNNTLKSKIKKVLKSFVPNESLRTFSRKVRNLNQAEKLKMSYTELHVLREIYKEEINDLSNYLKRDLNYWLEE